MEENLTKKDGSLTPDGTEILINRLCGLTELLLLFYLLL